MKKDQLDLVNRTVWIPDFRIYDLRSTYATRLSAGSGVFEMALGFRGDAFRVVYTLQIANEILVVHAFQRKSKHG